MNKIEEGIAANDAAITDVKNNYMPVSGGLFTGNMGIAGNLEILGNDTLALSTDGSITFPSAGGKLNGISDLKGTSSTIAASQKCLNDNYMPKTGGAAFSNPIAINGNLDMYGTISFPDTPHSNKLTAIVDDKGTSSTTAVSQKCLNDNYVAKSDLPSNLLKYQVINSTSDIGTDANTAYLILE